MEPQQFIKGVLVGEVKDVMANHAYLAFPLIGVGIEFRDSMRNGLLHFYRPKAGLFLSEVNGSIEGVITHGNHPYRDKQGNVTLVVEYLYIDFVDACHKVIKKRFPVGDKMRGSFLRTDIPIIK